jgi:AbrB family looped-hinge helix DNA binding protein
MSEFRAKMNENGRIVIPAACRRLLDIKPGEDLILLVEDHELRVFSLQHSLQKAKAIVRLHAKNKSLVKQLKTLRQSDKDHE